MIHLMTTPFLQLLDLCVLDISSRQFSPSCLAAAAIYHLINRCRESLLLITGDLSVLCIKSAVVVITK